MKATHLIAALSIIWLHAQSQSPPPKFDVVSIKTCKPGVTVAGGSSLGRLHIGCGLLAGTDNTGLIQLAYNRYASGQMTSYGIIPIEGGPDWVRSATFEIDAKSEGQPSFQMMEGPMMQAILEERFKLKIHRETRQGPVYDLTLGKGSPKLKSYEKGSCIPVSLGRALPPLTGGEHYCRNLVSPRAISFEGGTLPMFAALLRLIVDRPVIDKTGLTDYFQIQLAFSPGDSPTPPGAPGAPVESKAPDPDIFQAIQQQLGLKLTQAKGPVDVLVIDRIEKPSEN